MKKKELKQKIKELERQQPFNNSRFISQRVMGDSMHLSYSEGDMIIADTLDKNYAGGNMFMLDISKGAGTNVARLHPYKGGVEIMRENPHYKNYVVSKEKIRELIIGKIVGHISKAVLL